MRPRIDNMCEAPSAQNDGANRLKYIKFKAASPAQSDRINAIVPSNLEPHRV